MALEAKAANRELDLRGKMAVVTGGTQGIGEGIALRCAQLGVSRILIVGRNEERGLGVLEKLKEIARQRSLPDQLPPPAKHHFEFLQADLSTVQSVKKAAAQITDKVGPDGLDYLLMTQGGPPNGVHEETSEGHEKSFAVHCLSRFGLMYELAEARTLKQGSTVVSVFSPGYDDPAIDLADLSLKTLQASNPWRARMLLTQARRDSMINDAFTLEFNRRYPWMKVYHIFPGYVHTNAAANRGFPFPLPQLSAVFGPLLARTVGNTPLGYADVPLYLAAHPQARALDGFLFNERLKAIPLGSWAQTPENRARVFDKLRSFF